LLDRILYLISGKSKCLDRYFKYYFDRFFIERN